MKYLLYILLLFPLVFICSCDISYTTTEVDVRIKPRFNGKKINKLPINTKVISSSYQYDGWVFIGGIDSIALGFVLSKYLTQSNSFALTLEKINNNKKSMTKAADKTELISYYVHHEDIYDVPIKTQIRLEVIVEDKNVKKSQITELLETLYNKLIQRTGFKYHKNPTKIFIYIYSSTNEANNGVGNWLGMISTPYEGVTPEFKISPLMNSKVIEGCTDSNASNYDSRATIYDGSCLYNQRNIVNASLDKDKLIDTWLPLSKGDKLHKKIELFKDPSNDYFLKSTYVDGSYSIDFIEINKFKNKFIYEYENNHGQYFIRDKNTLKLYDEFGETDMLLQRLR